MLIFYLNFSKLRNYIVSVPRYEDIFDKIFDNFDKIFDNFDNSIDHFYNTIENFDLCFYVLSENVKFFVTFYQ